MTLFTRYTLGYGSDGSAAVEVAYPTWLATEARDAWRGGVQESIAVPPSKSFQKLTRVFDDLGVRHEVDRVTDDGCFSMDIYLPAHDVAVVFDGPMQCYYKSDSDKTLTRTAKTELRDFFLAKQCTTLVTMSWFEFAKCTTSEKRWRYVKDTLAKQAGVEVVMEAVTPAS